MTYYEICTNSVLYFGGRIIWAQTCMMLDYTGSGRGEGKERPGQTGMCVCVWWDHSAVVRSRTVIKLYQSQDSQQQWKKDLMVEWENATVFFFFFVVNFIIHWNDKALGSHVFPRKCYCIFYLFIYFVWFWDCCSFLRQKPLQYCKVISF